jgi:hypothetical protein
MPREGNSESSPESDMARSRTTLPLIAPSTAPAEPVGPRVSASVPDHSVTSLPPLGVPVFVIGDVSVDWLEANWCDSRAGKHDFPVWRSQPQVTLLAMLSGAWLLENMLLELAGPEGGIDNPHRYYCYSRPSPTPGEWEPKRRTADSNQYLHTVTELTHYPRGEDIGQGDLCGWSGLTCPSPSLCRRGTEAGRQEGYVYRVNGAAKYYGPQNGNGSSDPGVTCLRQRRAGETEAESRRMAGTERQYSNESWSSPRLVVIFDGDYGFRDDSKRWVSLLPCESEKAKHIHVVVFLRRRLLPTKYDKPQPEVGQTNLWETLAGYYSDRTTVVVSAESLREEEVDLSKSLSWEKTTLDFLSELGRENSVLGALAKVRHLVVRFGVSGAIHHRSKGGTATESLIRLHYDPRYVEGEYRETAQNGHMTGLTAVLTASVARSIADGLVEHGTAARHDTPSEWVDRGIRLGLANARILFCRGFGSTHQQVLRLETEDKWNGRFLSPKAVLESNSVWPPSAPLAVRDVPFDPSNSQFSLLGSARPDDITRIAERIVREGMEKALDWAARTFGLHIPVARFGDYWVVDRQEIESFRSIRNLLQGHRDKQTPLPLSIAVFGPPGSGKSFGVKEIVKGLGNTEDVEFLTYNLAQFATPDDLSLALLPVRDVALGDKLAVVFIDEFDSKLGSVELGWLKYFLPIMQDGEFKHHDKALKIGNPVLVFAGGTSYTYEGFYPGGDEAVTPERRAQKVPDFVSRLRGHVNIRGADKSDAGDDRGYVIRRAVFLRSILWRKYRRLFSTSKESTARLEVSDTVLRALLAVPKYKHGSRSLEAILDMSRLAGASQFDASMLPPNDQLEMHVDAQEFVELLRRRPV